MANPWDDPSLESETTKRIKASTARIRKEGLPKTPPAKKVGEIGITEAYGDKEMDLAGKLANRNRAVDRGTKFLRKAASGTK